MFTGIVQGTARVTRVQVSTSGSSIGSSAGFKLLSYSLQLPLPLLEGLKIGASVSVDGVCQTVVRIQEDQVCFDAIHETLLRTTLDSLNVDQTVNIERSARFGDEMGGHLVSGHVYGKAQITKIDSTTDHHVVKLQCPPEWTRYLFTKGFVALNGASLTLNDVDSAGFFTVNLIPETLRLTTFGEKKKGHWINVELDSNTVTIVETVERILNKKIKLM